MTPVTLDEQMREFGNRHLPVAQPELATLTVGAVPLGGLMVSQLNGQLLGGSGISITTVLLALERARAHRRVRELREPRDGASRAARARSRSAQSNRRESPRVMVQYLAEAAVLTVIAAAVALVAVRLLTPPLHNASAST